MKQRADFLEKVNKLTNFQLDSLRKKRKDINKIINERDLQWISEKYKGL